MKILVLGGTADSRRVARALVEAGEEIIFSVAGREGLATVPGEAHPLVGRRDSEEWIRVLASEGIDGVVDASHPYAVKAGQSILRATSELALPCCRYERPEVIPENAVVCPSAEEAVERALDLTRPGDVVFLTVGVKLLPRLVPPLRLGERKILARLLPTEESIKVAREAGLTSREILAVFGHGTSDLNGALFREFQVRVVLSKSSGLEGGIPEKAQAALSMGASFVLIARPLREGLKVNNIASVLETVVLWKKEVQPS